MSVIGDGAGELELRWTKKVCRFFLESPQSYSSDLPRSKKLLFMLAEIEQLDDSKNHHAGAAALLAQAPLDAAAVRSTDRRRLVVG